MRKRTSLGEKDADVSDNTMIAIEALGFQLAADDVERFVPIERRQQRSAAAEQPPGILWQFIQQRLRREADGRPIAVGDECLQRLMPRGFHGAFVLLVALGDGLLRLKQLFALEVDLTRSRLRVGTGSRILAAFGWIGCGLRMLAVFIEGQFPDGLARVIVADSSALHRLAAGPPVPGSALGRLKRQRGR